MENIQQLKNQVKSLSKINAELRRKNSLLKWELTTLQIKKQTYSTGVDFQLNAEKVIFEAIKSEYRYFEPWMLATKSRKTEYKICRQLFQALMIQYNVAPLKAIGMKTGGRDHSTILWAKKAIRDLIDTDKTFRVGYDNIVKQVEQGLYTPEIIGATIS